MRADRLVATLLVLQARGKVTAPELASELEVSERTARRDLEALSAAGVPVYSQPGRGGGWALLGGARTDLSGLTSDEARTLFMVAGPQAQATPELKAALRKLVRALPEPFRASAETAASAVVIDPGGWGQVRRQQHRPGFLDALQSAVAAGEQVRLGYADRAGQSTSRVVHPLGLAMKGLVWYLVANTDAGLRTFRVGRVTSVARTGAPVERPADFDLDQTWQRIVASVDRLRAPHRVEVRVDAAVVPALRWIFERQLQGVHSRAGDVVIRIGGPSVERIAMQLAGFGARVEVLDPPEARAYLARVAAELTATYGSPSVQPQR